MQGKCPIPEEGGPELCSRAEILRLFKVLQEKLGTILPLRHSVVQTDCSNRFVLSEAEQDAVQSAMCKRGNLRDRFIWKWFTF